MSVDPALIGKKAKAPKRYIKTNVTVHDRTQLETVFDYFVYRGPRKSKGAGATATGRTTRLTQQASSLRAPPKPKSLSYQVEVFLFYPRDFGLNAHTYPKERFFADIRPLLRFREPKIGFKTMLGTKPGSQSPLAFLRDYLQGLAREPLAPGEAPPQAALDEVRLFACTFVSIFLRNIERHRKRLRRQVKFDEPRQEEEFAKRCARLQRLLARSDQILGRYRELITLAETLDPDRVGPLLTELRLIDEYCYYRLRDGIAFLAGLVPPKCLVQKTVEPPELRALRADVLRVLAEHEAHAVRCGYLLVAADSPRADKERFIHRRSELKRRIWTVLFLEIRTTPLFALQRQVGAMVAAGIAALWAAIAQFLLVRKAMQPQQLTDVLGLSGMLFLSAAVLAYVVKDRIKEMGRSYFGGGIFRQIPDHSEDIFYNNRSGQPIVVGQVQERAKFVKMDALPDRIKALRSGSLAKDGLRGLAEVEQVEDGVTHALHYSKVIKLSAKLKILNRYPLRAVHDILRLNIDACLPRLAEPERMVELVDAAGHVASVCFPKVYYLDMILSYSKLENGDVAAERSLDFFRLVMEKNGLLRIERRN